MVNALTEKLLPVYVDCMQIRDLLYVKDHCSEIRRVLEAGLLGDVNNLGGLNEKPNIDIVQTICRQLDDSAPKPTPALMLGKSPTSPTVPPPRHNRRYAIDACKLKAEVGWNTG